MKNFKKLTLKEYENKMEIKYNDLIKDFNEKLLTIDSFNRGHLLYKLVDSEDCPEELKYYIFYRWWDSIDSYHDYFEADDIDEWLETTNIDMYTEVKNNLNLDSDGYVKVYRGTHEFNEGLNGKSWTTDKEVAIKFANGCGVRRPTKKPKILTGKVDWIYVLGIFNDRKENEVLCNMVELNGVEELGSI
ncbi:MAG: hypothetical protein N4A63_08205 [Vallitalea sp.]|jgi:hypothetical protein|nr:hypothetical protein [Vallitalea sp.]